MSRPFHHEAVKRAAKAVGGQIALAQIIGCSQAEISRLANEAFSIRVDVAIKIAAATRGTEDEVRIEELLSPEMVSMLRAELAPEPERLAG